MKMWTNGRAYRTGAGLVGVAAALGLGVGAADAQTFTDQAATLLGGANFNSRSASLGDMDNDGDLDLLFQGAAGAQQLFRNDLIGSGGGTLGYTNVTSTMLPAIGSSWSAAWGDYDSDGNTDIFVGKTNFGVSGTVLRNDLGTATAFTDQSVAVGLDDPGFHQNVAWSDIDNDNDLDLIVAMEGPEKHEIYLQDDVGNFSAVGAAAGFQVDFGTKAYGMAIGDTDGDGDLDIYISTCRPGGNIRNNFFENQLAQTGTLSFVDIADDNGTQFTGNSYGSEFHDFDNDGDLDLYMTGADGNASKLWRNDGDNFFTDTDFIREAPLLTDTAGDLNGARAVDYDNDGDLDLFFHDHLALGGTDTARKLYRNDGDWNFTDVTAAEGLEGPNAGSYDSTWGDLDRDGDQDLVATTDSGSAEHVFLSDASTNGNGYLYVTLDGITGNTTGIGSTLYATLDGGTEDEVTLRREANTNAGTFNQSDLPVHFGLGDATLIDELKIVWADGKQQTLFDVAVDQYLSVAYDAFLAGDFNGDGFVSQGDLDLVLLNWGDAVLPAGWAADDQYDGDLISQNELDAVLLNWGNGTPPATSAAIPEPASLTLLALTVLLVRRHAR